MYLELKKYEFDIEAKEYDRAEDPPTGWIVRAVPATRHRLIIGQ